MMFRQLIALATLATVAQAQKNVFAHFIVGNANGNNDLSDWKNDIAAAQAAHIDGFALNIAAGQPQNAASLSLAFQAANSLGDFKLFFSFDFAANGAWAANDITSLLSEYATNGAYFLYKNQPLVSTFEGPNSSGIWPAIISKFNVFFIPDWSSLGAAAAEATGVTSGLFSWEAWPNGATDMTLAGDKSYIAALAGKPYMMPVSPWFYTNLPSYGKNWLWRGDSLWYDRWAQVLTIQPEFVEIISWNDFGESHYIGPINDKDLGLFTAGHAPYDYTSGHTHDGWRTFLPYVIDTYKSGGVAPNIPSEQVVAWYRLNPNKACATGGTTGNTASQGQTELSPSLVAIDAVFFTALLKSAATYSVTIGSTVHTGAWRNTPASGSGLYHGSVPWSDGQVGPVTVTINRNGAQVVSVTGDPITTSCTGGIENWNAAVYTSDSTPI